MAGSKRKSLPTDDEDVEESEAKSSEEEKPKSKVKKPKKVKDDDDDDEQPKAKKAKSSKASESKKASSSSSSGQVKKNDEGEQYIDLGKRKRATVRVFKGVAMVDIREFYEDKDTGAEKPGKKGVSLQMDQASPVTFAIVVAIVVAADSILTVGRPEDLYGRH
ncbi:transcriptional Coactivator p15-domain-containing protein [Mycena floridula]|nr:transcriptional Coactivator p15-domain-containing protein [Mycena floridula]